MTDFKATQLRVWLLAMLTLPLVTGCDGCRRESGQPAESGDAQPPLEDFQSLAPRPMPTDRVVSNNGVKPGHWFTASQSLRSNQGDVRGQLISRAEAARINPAGEVEVADPARASAAVRVLESERPVVLPKGQTRRFDVRLLAPRYGGVTNRQLHLTSRFVASGRTSQFDTPTQVCTSLAAEEYFIVVLTTSPDRFARLQTADWVRRLDDESSSSGKASYRLVFPTTEGLLPVASTVLDWTHTAVLIWDDVPADVLTPDQLQAISDWVHFGGRLIVNGSDATDALATSPLAGLLPIDVTGNVELDPDAVTDLLRSWSVVGDLSTAQQINLARDRSSRIAVGGDRSPDATAVTNTRDLVVQRRVGRGTVCQTRFHLTSDWLQGWQSLDSFFNAALLGRPARRFLLEDGSQTQGQVPTDGQESIYEYQRVLQQFVDERYTQQLLPAINTNFRLASRDAVLSPAPIATAAEPRPSDAVSDEAMVDPTATAKAGDELATESAFTQTRIDTTSGVGGWSDQSDVVLRMRAILAREAGIEIPKSSLVVRALGIYLFLLVPVNYLVFRLLGRLEFAWLAAPVIAVVGAAWVARAAQLDIGFARSQTQLATLELPANYSRGHLSRVVAVYNSLSTEYDIHFSSPHAAAAPFGIFAPSPEVTDAVFKTSLGAGPHLTGLNIGSNQIRLVHTEELVDVGGQVRRDGDFLVNETRYELLDGLVVERLEGNSAQVAAVASCPPNGRVRLRFFDSTRLSLAEDMPMQTATLIGALSSPLSMEPGSSRVVARIDALLPGMQVHPEATQTSGQTILLAHLRYEELAEPAPDANLVRSLTKNLSEGAGPSEPLDGDDP